MKELLKQYRRDLHQIPETAYQEFKTHKYILEILRNYSCEITEFTPTGICAFFQAKNPKYPGTVAFRSEMDALSIEEMSGFPYRSTHSGVMHACGHDGHMAMLLCLAGELAKSGGDLPVNALLIFQPAEEGSRGAAAIVDSGILDKYDARRVFAFHMAPSDTPGVIMTRPFEITAKSSALTIAVHGKSAHIASAHKGIDSLHIGCLYLDALYQMERTVLPPEEFRLLKFGMMTGGTVRNAIAETTVLEGSLRAYREDIFHLLSREIRRIATGFEEEYGCEIQVRLKEGYPAVINDPKLYRQAEEILSPEHFPESPGFITMRKPSMISEDFSYYLQKIPGLYLFLGSGNKEPLHSNLFDLHEEALEVGVRAYLRLLQLPVEPQSSGRPAE